MSRWHALDCQNPQVIVQDGLPRCKTCKNCPDLDRIRERYPSHPSLSIPPDPPPGQLNLWWPKCVPYVSEIEDPESSSGGSSVTERNADVETQGGSSTRPAVPEVNHNNPSRNVVKPAGDTQGSEPVHSYVYSRPLRQGEFRLIALNAASGAEHAIHIDLEVHSRDNSPEYETCSYTWGGEEDDTTPYEPVYVGRYWDVILQTKNCYSMLQYLRPRRGIRILWVDAICINQCDLDDRAVQVSRMNEIYQRGTRVVVFLGKDLAPPRRPGQYSRQKPLLDLLSRQEDISIATPESPNIQKIIARRYFGRLWIIQELVLSRQIVLPIADTEYWADASIHGLMGKYEHLQDFWNRCNVPWAALLATSGRETVSLYRGFQLASASASSDPRDKFFAMHSLLNSAHVWKEMTPDYRLSYSQLLTGVSAFCLLQEGGTGLLFHASAGRGPAGWPTWVPLNHSNFVQWSQDLGHRRQLRNSFREFQGQEELPAHSRITIITNSHWGLNHCLCASSLKVSPWNQSATVKQHSGALAVDIRNVAGFVKKPILFTSLRNSTLRIYQVKHLNCALYLVTHHTLDECVNIEADRLWALEETSSIKYVILRPIAKRKAFSIVAYCDYMYFALDQSSVSRPNYCLRCVETTFWTHILACCNELSQVRDGCSRRGKLAEMIYGIRSQNVDAALLVSQCLIDSDRSKEHSPSRYRDWNLSYRKYLLAELEGVLSEPVRFHSRLDDTLLDHIKISVDFEDLRSLAHGSIRSKYERGQVYLGPHLHSYAMRAIKTSWISSGDPWQNEREASDSIESPSESYRELYMMHRESRRKLSQLPKGTIAVESAPTSSKSIRMVAPLRALQDPWRKQSTTYAILEKLRIIAPKVGKTELELLKFEPEDDPELYQKLSRMRMWPDEIVEAFKVDGRKQRINIV